MKYLDYFVILNLIAYCSILYFPIFDNFMRIFFGIINAVCLYGYLVDLYDNKFCRYVVITYNKDKDNDVLRKTLLYWMTSSADWNANKEDVYQIYVEHGLQSEFSGSLGL